MRSHRADLNCPHNNVPLTKWSYKSSLSNETKSALTKNIQKINVLCCSKVFVCFLFFCKATKSTLSSALLLSLVTSKKSLTCCGGVALKKDPQERENWMRPIPDESKL